MDSEGSVEHQPAFSGNSSIIEATTKSGEGTPDDAEKRRREQCMILAPDFARSSLQCALDLHEVIRESAGSRNILFSPFMLSSALMALYNGARGRTAEQIARAARLGYDEPPVVSSCLPLWHSLLFPTWPDSNRRNFEIHHDCCLVYDKGIRISDGYRKWLSRWCRVEAEDFANDPTDGVVFPTRMTAWIGALTSFSCKTPEDASFWSEVDRSTSLFLLSLLFIKGKWRHVFHVTRGFFHETQKKSKVVRMMSHTGRFRMTHSEEMGASFLELPYREHKKTMVILLPDPPNSLRDLERKLNAHHILACLDKLEDKGPLNVSVPMFRVSDVIDLKEALPALGVNDAFQPDADFSTLCDSAARVSFARHVAVFHARERSTSQTPKCSGAQLPAGSTSTPPAADDDGEQKDEEVKFIVDRPFLFLIMNSEPKAVLLFGSVRKIFAWK
ncbi:iris-like [Rhipicephalus microplus]|uniref:iris-like n=1 Tax=Rhipicephalus microplus TaxID=6941 RepID=UPI002376C444